MRSRYPFCDRILYMYTRYSYSILYIVEYDIQSYCIYSLEYLRDALDYLLDAKQELLGGKYTILRYRSYMQMEHYL